MLLILIWFDQTVTFQVREIPTVELELFLLLDGPGMGI